MRVVGVVLAITMFWYATPAFAVFTVDNTAATDSGLTSLHKSGDFPSGDGITEGKGGLADWHTATSEPAGLESEQNQWLSFEVNKSYLGSYSRLKFLNSDGMSVAKVQAVPAPGAILLVSIGAGIVGWLRNRKAV